MDASDLIVPFGIYKEMFKGAYKNEADYEAVTFAIKDMKEYPNQWHIEEGATPIFHGNGYTIDAHEMIIDKTYRIYLCHLHAIFITYLTTVIKAKRKAERPSYVSNKAERFVNKRKGERKDDDSIY